MEDDVAGVSVGPDAEENVVAGGAAVDLRDELLGGAYGLAVDFEDDVAGLQAGVFSGTGLADVGDGDALYAIGKLELLTHVRGEVGDGQAQLARLGGARCAGGVIGGRLGGVGAVLAYGDVDGLGVAVAQDAERDVLSGGVLADGDLEGAGVDDGMAVELDDDVA